MHHARPTSCGAGGAEEVPEAEVGPALPPPPAIMPPGTMPPPVDMREEGPMVIEAPGPNPTMGFCTRGGTRDRENSHRWGPRKGCT